MATLLDTMQNLETEIPGLYARDLTQEEFAKMGDLEGDAAMENILTRLACDAQGEPFEDLVPPFEGIPVFKLKRICEAVTKAYDLGNESDGTGDSD